MRLKAVLFVTHEHSSGEASLRYRSVHHAESLGFLGVSCDVTRYGAPDLLSAIAEYQCIVLHRFPSDAAAPLVRRARKLGKLLVSDTDDLVFNHAVAHHIEAIEDMSDEWREAWAESYRRTIEDCGSGATASTKTLRRHLLTLAGPVEVLPNVVNDEMSASRLTPGARRRRRAAAPSPKWRSPTSAGASPIAATSRRRRRPWSGLSRPTPTFGSSPSAAWSSTRTSNASPRESSGSLGGHGRHSQSFGTDRHRSRPAGGQRVQRV